MSGGGWSVWSMDDRTGQWLEVAENIGRVEADERVRRSKATAVKHGITAVFAVLPARTKGPADPLNRTAVEAAMAAARVTPPAPQTTPTPAPPAGTVTVDRGLLADAVSVIERLAQGDVPVGYAFRRAEVVARLRAVIGEGS